MNTNLKWKLVVGLLLAFLAGAATGGFLAARQAHHRKADFDQRRHSLAERMRDRMRTRLQLTPEQVEKTGPIFDQAAVELEKIRRETGQQVKETMAATNRALTPILTDEQRAKMADLEKTPRENRGPHHRLHGREGRGRQGPARIEPGPTP